MGVSCLVRGKDEGDEFREGGLVLMREFNCVMDAIYQVLNKV